MMSGRSTRTSVSSRSRSPRATPRSRRRSSRSSGPGRRRRSAVRGRGRRRRRRTKRGKRNVSKLRRAVLLRNQTVGLKGADSSNPLLRAVKLLLAEKRDAAGLEPDDAEEDGSAPSTPLASSASGNTSLWSSLLSGGASSAGTPLLFRNSAPGSPGLGSPKLSFSLSSSRNSTPRFGMGQLRPGGSRGLSALSRFKGAAKAVGRFRGRRGRARGRGRGRRRRSSSRPRWGQRKVGNRLARLRAAARFTGRLARLRVNSGLRRLPLRRTRSRTSVTSKGSALSEQEKKKVELLTTIQRKNAARRGRHKLRSVTKALGLAVRLQRAAANKAVMRKRVLKRQKRRDARTRAVKRSSRSPRRKPRGGRSKGSKSRSPRANSQSSYSSCSTNCSCTTVWISDDDAGWMEDVKERGSRVLSSADTLAGVRARLDGLVTLQRSFLRANAALASDPRGEQLVKHMQSATEAVIKAENLRSFAVATPDSQTLAVRFVEAVPIAAAAVHRAHEAFAEVRLEKSTAVDTLKTTVSEAAVELAALESRTIDVEARNNALPEEFRESALPVDTLMNARDAVQSAQRVMAELQQALGTTSLDLDVLNLRPSIAAALSTEVELAEHFVGRVRGAAEQVDKASELVAAAERVAAERQLVVDIASVPERLQQVSQALAVLQEANEAVHCPADRATEALERARAALSTAQGLHQLPPGMGDPAQTVEAVTTTMRLVTDAQVALEDRTQALQRLLRVQHGIQQGRRRSGSSDNESAVTANRSDNDDDDDDGDDDDDDDGDGGADDVTMDDAVTALAVSRASLQALVDNHQRELEESRAAAEAAGDNADDEVARANAELAVTAQSAAEALEAAESLRVLVESTSDLDADGEGADSVLPRFIEMVAAATANVNRLTLLIHQRTHPEQARAKVRAEQLIEEVKATYERVVAQMQEQRAKAGRAGAQPSPQEQALLEATERQLAKAEEAKARLVGPLATPSSIATFIRLVGQAEQSVHGVARANKMLTGKDLDKVRMMELERRLINARQMHSGQADATDTEATGMLNVAESALAAAQTLASVMDKPGHDPALEDKFKKALDMVEAQAGRVEVVLQKREENVVSTFVEEFKKAEARIASLHADVEHLKKGYRRLGTNLDSVEHDLDVASTAVSSAETIRSIVKASPEFQQALSAVLVANASGSAGPAPQMPPPEMVALAKRFVAAVGPAVEATEALADTLSAVGVEQRPGTARARDVSATVAELRDLREQVEAMDTSQRTVEQVAPTSALAAQAVRVRSAIQGAAAAVRLAQQLGDAVERSPGDRDLYQRFTTASRRASGAMNLATESQKSLMAQVLDPVVSALALLDGLQRRVGMAQQRFGGTGVEEHVSGPARAAVEAAKAAVEKAAALKKGVLDSTGTVKPDVLGSVPTTFDPTTGELTVTSPNGTHRRSVVGSVPIGGGEEESKGSGTALSSGQLKGTTFDGLRVDTFPGPAFVESLRAAIQQTIAAETEVSRVVRVAKMRQASRAQVVYASKEVSRISARLAKIDERFHREKARDLSCGEAPATLEGIMIASTLLSSAKQRDVQRAKQADLALRQASAAGADEVELDRLADQLVATVRVASSSLDAVEEALLDAAPHRDVDNAVAQARDLDLASRHVSASNKFAVLRATMNELERDNARRMDDITGGRMLQKEYIEALEDRAVLALDTAQQLQPGGADHRRHSRKQSLATAERELAVAREKELQGFVRAIGDASLAIEAVHRVVGQVEEHSVARGGPVGAFNPLPGGDISPNVVGMTLLQQSASSSSLAAALVDGPTSYGRVVEEVMLSTMSLDAAAMMPYPRPGRFEDVGPEGLYNGSGGSHFGPGPGSVVGSQFNRSETRGNVLGSPTHTSSPVSGVRLSPRAARRPSNALTPRHAGSGEPPAVWMPHSLDAEVLVHDLAMCVAREKVIGLEFRELISEVQGANMSSLPLETGLPLKQAISESTSTLRAAEKFRHELEEHTLPRDQRRVHVARHVTAGAGTASVASTGSVGPPVRPPSVSHISVRSGPAAMAPSPRRLGRRYSKASLSSQGPDVESVLGGRTLRHSASHGGLSGFSSAGYTSTDRSALVTGTHGTGGVAVFTLSAAFAASSLFEELVRQAGIAVSQFQVAFDDALDEQEQGGTGGDGPRVDALAEAAGGEFRPTVADVPSPRTRARTKSQSPRRGDPRQPGLHSTPSAPAMGAAAAGAAPPMAGFAPDANGFGSPQMSQSAGAAGWASYQQQMMTAIQQTRMNFMLRAASQQYDSLLARRYEHEKTMEKASFMAQRARFEARLQMEKQQAAAHQRALQQAGVAGAAGSPAAVGTPSSAAGSLRSTQSMPASGFFSPIRPPGQSPQAAGSPAVGRGGSMRTMLQKAMLGKQQAAMATGNGGAAGPGSMRLQSFHSVPSMQMMNGAGSPAHMGSPGGAVPMGPARGPMHSYPSAMTVGSSFGGDAAVWPVHNASGLGM